MLRLLSACLLLTAPTAANACDLDGMFGYHRFNPFASQMDQQAGATSQEYPQPAVVKDDSRTTPVEALSRQPERRDASAEPNSNQRQDEPRKWEQPGSEPVSAEDLATYR